jgi:hypothetical protein
MNQLVTASTTPAVLTLATYDSSADCGEMLALPQLVSQVTLELIRYFVIFAEAVIYYVALL